MSAIWRFDAELIMNDGRPQPWMAFNATSCLDNKAFRGRDAEHRRGDEADRGHRLRNGLREAGAVDTAGVDAKGREQNSCKADEVRPQRL
jgi:hypothetical protein